MAHVAAFDAADHGIGLAADHRKCCDHGVVGADHGARGFGRDAAPSGHVDIGLHIGAVARIVLGIDEIEILPGLDREAEPLEPGLDDGGASDQDRPRQFLLKHDLRRAQHALVLALGIDHADRLRLGLGEHRLHDEAGAERKAFQQRGIFVEILDRPRRHAGFHRGFRHRRRDAQDQPRIERARDQRARTEALRLAAVKPAGHRVRRRIARELRDRVDGGMLHFLVDAGGADVERAAEDEREAQDVVDLVREVGTPGADHRVGARFARLVRHDFRVRIGQRHHQRLVRHRLDHLGLQHVGRGNPQEDIGAADHVGQHARIGLLRIDRLPAVHQRVAALMHHAVDVADPDVLALRAERDQKIQARDRGSACARADDLHIRQLLAVQQQRVGDRGARR